MEQEWIDWEGGNCPVSEDVVMEVRFRDGDVEELQLPTIWIWDHREVSGDIVAYRLAQGE